MVMVVMGGSSVDGSENVSGDVGKDGGGGGEDGDSG